jgi:hypothetical protein
MFIEWTKKTAFYLAGLVFTVFLSIFIWLNIGIGPSKELSGIVSSIGLDTSNPLTTKGDRFI